MISGTSIVTIHNRYPVALAGQTVAACAQPLFMFAPTKLAALWFQDSQRATANMVASMGSSNFLCIRHKIIKYEEF